MRFVVVLCALLAPFLPAAHAATTLAFEGQPNTVYETPIVREGYTIGTLFADPSAPLGNPYRDHFHEVDSGLSGYSFSQFGNGTGVLLNDTDRSIYIKTLGSELFMLTGDLGAFATYLGSDTPVNLLTIFGASGGSEGGFMLDNVMLSRPVSSVPEPASWALMMVGFGAIGAGMRMRRRRDYSIRGATPRPLS